MTLENYAVFGKYFYHDLKHTLKAFNHKESKKCFKFIEKYKNDFYILMLTDYELYRYFQDKISQAKRLICLYLLLKKEKKFQKKILMKKKFIPEFINFFRSR